MEENIKYISQEQMDQQMSDSSFVPEEGVSYLVGTPEQLSGKGNDGNDKNDFTPSPYWELYKSKLPETDREAFKLPDGINKENEQQLLDEHLKKLYAPQDDPFENIHPLAKEIIDKSKEDNFNPEEFIKSKVGISSLANASDDDLIKAKYIKEIGLKSDSNPTGMTEDEILDGIKELNPLEKRKMANEERQKYQESIKQSFEYKQDPAAMQKEISKYNNGIKEFANDFFVETKDLPETKQKEIIQRRTIAGVDIGEAKFQELKSEFENSFTINEKGVAPIQEMLLNNDKALVKAFMFLKNEEMISQALTRRFNDGKDFILDKLELHGRQISGVHGVDGKMSREEYEARLDAPEGTFKN